MLNGDMLEKELLEKEYELRRINKTYSLIYDILIKENACKIIQGFKQKEYKTIMLYGAGLVCRVLAGLLNTHFNVIIMDRDGISKYYYDDFEICILQKNIKSDIIIVTLPGRFNAIKKDLSDFGYENIININDLMYPAKIGADELL